MRIADIFFFLPSLLFIFWFDKNYLLLGSEFDSVLSWEVFWEGHLLLDLLGRGEWGLEGGWSRS